MYEDILKEYFDHYAYKLYINRGALVPRYFMDEKITDYVQSLVACQEGEKHFWIDSYRGEKTGLDLSIYLGRRFVGGKQVAAYGAMAFSYMLYEYEPFPLRKKMPYLLVAYKNSDNPIRHTEELPNSACTVLELIGNKVIYFDDAGLLVKKTSLIPVVQPDVCTFEEALSVLL